MLELSISVLTLLSSDSLRKLTELADDNSSYFNMDMLYSNYTLLNQVAQEYYVNKTGARMVKD